MTRNELVGSLIDEGFDRQSAENEADLILGSRDDDSTRHLNVALDVNRIINGSMFA